MKISPLFLACLFAPALIACSGSEAPAEIMLEVGDNPTPPGDDFVARPAEYASAWAAKELCSRVFVAGGDPQDTIDREVNLVGLAADGFNFRSAEVDIDQGAQTVTVSHPGEPPRQAVYALSQGCVILPRGTDALGFEPVSIEWRGPAADDPWPLGETVTPGVSPIGRDALDAAMERHMDRPGLRAIVVVHQGELVGETYAPGYGAMVPQRGWSTGKSVAATAIGRLVDRGYLNLDDPAPVAAWADDERSQITLRHLVNMSSGLNQQFLDGFTSFFAPSNEHAFVYVEGFDTVADAVEVPPGMFSPGTDYAYRNANPLTATAIGRLAFEANGGEPFAFIAREVFEPLGMRSSLVETDPYGNFITSGAFYTTARDLARLALVHLNGGVLGGTPVLSQEWAEFAYAPSEGFIGYGAFWRNNLDDRFNMPTDAFFANGGFGQKSVAIPSRELVIAQMGFDPLTDFENFELLVNEVVAVVDAID
ncbi:MAG: serine hydrolase domain-containing protein [Myxococcota bacterium]